MIPRFIEDCAICEEYVQPNQCKSWCHCKGKGDHCSWHFPEFRPCRCYENKWSKGVIDQYLESLKGDYYENLSSQ